MSYHQRPYELRLAIASEAEALISSFGDEASVEGHRRAEEASSDFLARDWSEVALVIARKRENARRCWLGCFFSDHHAPGIWWRLEALSWLPRAVLLSPNMLALPPRSVIRRRTLFPIIDQLGRAVSIPTAKAARTSSRAPPVERLGRPPFPPFSMSAANDPLFESSGPGQHRPPRRLARWGWMALPVARHRSALTRRLVLQSSWDRPIFPGAQSKGRSRGYALPLLRTRPVNQATCRKAR
jgi:hypothetical protein